MTAQEITALIEAADPISAAMGLPQPSQVTWSRTPHPTHWLVDGDAEGDVGAHRAAHIEGRPSEAVVRYGADTSPTQVGKRIAALAALARESDLLRFVHLVPGDDTADRPGSWGVEDLVVTAAARRAMPHVAIRPDWERLGVAACQVAVAFGATDWLIPADDQSDPDHLAAAVGARAVAR